MLHAGGIAGGVGGALVAEGATELATGTLGVAARQGTEEAAPYDPEEVSGGFWGAVWNVAENLPYIGTAIRLGETIECYATQLVQADVQDGRSGGT